MSDYVNGVTDAEIKALEVIALGEPIEEHWHEEGDGGSGPMGGTVFGYRHGTTVLEMTPDGFVVLYEKADEDVVLASWRMIHNSARVYEKSYRGVGAMIKDHLAAIERNASRNGLEFVKTGRRPTEGYYSLPEILKREEARA